MKYLIVIVGFLLCNVSIGQDTISNKGIDKKNTVYVELAGRGYFSLNYDRGWGRNRASIGLGWNHMDSFITPEEAIAHDVDGDHEVLPYLLIYTQYSRLFGNNGHYLELGFGTITAVYEMDRNEIANKLHDSESYLSVYPLIGYRYEGAKGFFFLASFNPLIELRQGSFWPIPGFSFGYRF